MPKRVQYHPQSFGHKFLLNLSKGNRLPDYALVMKKNQIERHAATFDELFKTSANTALFLPVNGKYPDPPWLSAIQEARPFVGELNTKRGAIRKSGPYGISTPECSHGLGCTDWLMHCYEVKATNEKYLTHVLKKHNLTDEEIAYLSIVRIACLMYLHDVVEDNRKMNPNITAKYVAREAVSRLLDEPYFTIMSPIIQSDIEAFTDKPDISKAEKLSAQKIFPQKEYELLHKLKILTKKSKTTGPIGTGKFIDKAHQNCSDLLVLETGGKSFFNSLEEFHAHIEPRIDIVESLHTPKDYASLYMETIERIFFRLRYPVAPSNRDEAQKIIHFNLTRYHDVLTGKPHVPLSRKFYSLPPIAGLAR